MCCLPLSTQTRLLIGLAVVFAVTGFAASAQEVKRGAGKRQQDPRVRDGSYGQQAPPSIHGTLVDLHPSGGFVIDDGSEKGVVAVDRSTEIIIRGQADESFVSIGSLVELTGTLEGQRGPISTNYVVVLQVPAKGAAGKTRWQPAFQTNIPMPGENRPATATIRGQVVSLSPVVVSAGNQKVPIRIEEPVQVWVEVAGGDARTLCKEGDRVDVAFQAQQRKDALVAQTITITRSEPFTASDTEKAAKDTKKKGDQPADKEKKPAKAMPKGKGAAKPEPPNKPE